MEATHAPNSRRNLHVTGFDLAGDTQARAYFTYGQIREDHVSPNLLARNGMENWRGGYPMIFGHEFR
jgi:hypothetical protein